MEVRPDIGASLAAGLTDEPCFELGEPDVIGPLVRAGRNGMAAMEIRAVNEDAARACRAHFSEGDFLRSFYHPCHAKIELRLCVNR